MPAEVDGCLPADVEWQLDLEGLPEHRAWAWGGSGLLRLVLVLTALKGSRL